MTPEDASKGMSMGRTNKRYPGIVVDFIKGVEPTDEPPVGPLSGLKCHKCTMGELAFVPPDQVNASKKSLEDARININRMELGLTPPEWVPLSCND